MHGQAYYQCSEATRNGCCTYSAYIDAGRVAIVDMLTAKQGLVLRALNYLILEKDSEEQMDESTTHLSIAGLSTAKQQFELQLLVFTCCQ